MNKFLLLCFLSVIAAQTNAQNTIIKYLSGTDKDHTVKWDFYCTDGQNSGKWTKIAVPSNWEQQGFGAYNYGQDKIKASEQGLYKYKFSVDPAWHGKKVFIVFDGSMTDTEVKINGKSAGDVHQGSFYRFKYDITDMVKPGDDNLLEVTVSKMSANKSVNMAERNGDFWIFGGIYRPVYLEITPNSYIERVAIDAKADGSFLMDVYGKNTTSSQTVTAQVQTLSGQNVGSPMTINADPSADKVTLKGNFEAPLLWSAEFPNLYQIVISLTDANGIVHQIKQQFGFRTVELRKNDGFYVNGVKIMFKGCDRHSFWPETARTLSHDVHVLDVNLMKEMNMNAVRMSHYPPDADFLHVCDSLGLYVLDELTGWHWAYDTIVGHKLVKEMVVRDVNHPSVVIWDNGNEGGWNVALDNDYDIYDPQNRIVIHPWTKLNGTNTKHYPDYNYLLNSVATEKDVFFPTEFMHGLYDGGAGAALDDFWDLMMQHPHSAGGFIWAFLDEAVMRTDKNGAYDTDGNHAPDGIVGPHREKEGSFFAIKQIWSPVYIDAVPIDDTFKGSLNIQNRYSFTNLNQCTFSWKLASLPDATDKGLGLKNVIEGSLAPVNLAPGQKGQLKLNLPATWAKSDVLYVTAFGPDKKEVFTWSWAIHKPSVFVKTVLKGTYKTKVSLQDKGTGLIVLCDGIKYFFDKKTGYIEKVVKPKAEISLSNGPLLAGVSCDLKQFKDTLVNGQCIVDADYQGATSSLHVEWTFASGKTAKLQYQYSQQGEADYMGLSFNYPEDKITGMKWLGRGPYHVYKNRLKGQEFGVWHKAYNDAVTGEDWIYPEFKGYHAEVNWVVIENKEASFTVYTDDNDLYFQMLRPKREKDALKNNNVEPPYPDGSLGFLKAIAPIGTKFQPARVMGPQSQKNIATGQPVAGTLYFDFR